MTASSEGVSTLILHPACQVTVEAGKAIVKRDGVEVRIEADTAPVIEKTWYSEEYGKEKETHKLCFPLKNNTLKTRIWIERY